LGFAFGAAADVEEGFQGNLNVEKKNPPPCEGWDFARHRKQQKFFNQASVISPSAVVVVVPVVA